MKMIDRFKNFTCQANSGFKVTFANGYTVSVSFTDHNLSETFDDNGNEIIPREKIAFTFDTADLAVFKSDRKGLLTGEFCSEMNNYDPHDNVIIFVTPEQVAEVMCKVSRHEN